ncbi:gluconate 2-dehydrogenase subunit 3 family protein [Paenibacillus roseipurpureus]|uniref:Gluconate 2-dehydrogenase subunit 3 family protein n=1 Tax=Paenibacillus roseopurpureus TaxID=2918901 RepID=A0AA96LPU7_9BACL|nr:gluconate 2-dehydrogenase subunit 3 family protein [Paenibacillus sp. MBLB1832]WNR42700.1 gluconate 2-dehydrogenase subunit 3 family protein [Paenibacillus sp. MBLB1832]
MSARIYERSNWDQYVLNHCTKYLARENETPRHNYNMEYSYDDPKAFISENWRFPIVDSSNVPNNNAVTFVYAAPTTYPAWKVSVVGTFSDLFDGVPLKQIVFGGEPTRYYACSVLVPMGEVHTYKFNVNGQFKLDPINPQMTTLGNAQTWSRFFTQFCTTPISFQPWERKILDRFAEHILPFRTEEGSKFLQNYYNYLDRGTKEREYHEVYQLDEQVGVSNFIDKLVAKEEFHRLQDYRICLSIIDGVLRKRRPGQEPTAMSREVYVDLYNEMAQGNVDGWDYARYGDPKFFLQLVRRHTIIGAFAHPKYGGNIGAAGWSFLSETFCDQAGNLVFDWQRAIEKPLGHNNDYVG